MFVRFYIHQNGLISRKKSQYQIIMLKNSSMYSLVGVTSIRICKGEKCLPTNLRYLILPLLRLLELAVPRLNLLLVLFNF